MYDIKGFEGYKIDTNGRVYEVESGMFLYHETLPDGGEAVVLRSGDTMKVVRVCKLMADTFGL